MSVDLLILLRNANILCVGMCHLFVNTGKMVDYDYTNSNGNKARIIALNIIVAIVINTRIYIINYLIIIYYVIISMICKYYHYLEAKILNSYMIS